MSLSLVRMLTGICAAASLGLATNGWAQETIKIGVVGHMTGPFAVSGVGYRQGIEAYLALHGNTVGGRKVEVLYRDSSGGDPSKAKRIAEELIVKDGVSILGGFMLSPEVAATAPVVNESKTPLLIFSASSPTLTPLSPYFVKMGTVITQMADLAAIYARQNGKTRGYIAVADFVSGHAVEQAFDAKFKAEGGQIVGKDRIPMSTVDFAPFAERIANANPDVLQIFLVPGAPAVSFIKALAARGLMNKLMVIGQGETEDGDLHLFDDSVIGAYSVLQIVARLDNKDNKAFRGYLQKQYGPATEPNAFSVGAYDGMHLAFKMIESQAGKPFNGEAAVKGTLGYAYQSPSGPVKIDPATRENIRNFYVRRVIKKDGVLQNTIVKTFDAVQPPAAPK